MNGNVHAEDDCSGANKVMNKNRVINFGIVLR